MVSGVSPSQVNDKCRLCESDRFTVIDRVQQAGQWFTIARCLACTLVYVQETHGDVSPNYIALDQSDISSQHLWLQSQHKLSAFRQFRRKFEELNSAAFQNHKRLSLLDVGCGTGGFLDFVAPDFSCYGFDASAAQAAHAQVRFPRVYPAVSLSQYRMLVAEAPQAFDVITLWDVLEHIRQPVPFLQDLVSGLASGGYLFVSVPNAIPMILKRKLFGPDYKGWHPEEHICYYSPTTLRLLFEKAGLATAQLGATVAYPRPWSAFEILRRIGFAVTRPFPKSAFQIYAFARRQPLAS